MYGYGRALSPLYGAPVEGAFAYSGPQAPVLSPNAPYPTVQGSLTAAPGPGCILGRFGWVDASTGHVSSVAGAGAPVWVLPQYGTWQKIYFDDVTQAWWLRPGLPVTCAPQGVFWGRFANGAVGGDPVYASNVDGSCLSGYSANGTLTRWTVQQGCGPGGLAIINSWGI